MEKTLAELKLLHNYQVKHLGPQAQILAVGLSSRKNLCVNSTVLAAENRDSVDAACWKLTASWVRNLAAENPNVPTCEFYEEYEKAGSGAVLPPGVYTLQDLRAYGKQRWWFIVISTCLIPKWLGLFPRKCKRSLLLCLMRLILSIMCVLKRLVLVRGGRQLRVPGGISKMQHEIERLRKEYNRLVEGLAQGGNLPITDTWLQNLLYLMIF
ncbi:hypothetical protein ACFXTO_008200 [Malus domestica]